MLHQILEDGRIQLVMDFLTFAPGADEAGVPENRQMARDGRPTRCESRRDLARRPRTTPQHAQDVPAGLVGECLKRCLRSHGHSYLPLYD